MTVLPLPSHGRWVQDLRGEGRAVRVSAHADRGLLVLSVWRAGACVGTVQLRPDEAAELVTGLAEGLAHLAPAGPSGPLPHEVTPLHPPAAADSADL